MERYFTVPVVVDQFCSQVQFCTNFWAQLNFSRWLSCSVALYMTVIKFTNIPRAGQSADHCVPHLLLNNSQAPWDPLSLQSRQVGVMLESWRDQSYGSAVQAVDFVSAAQIWWCQRPACCHQHYHSCLPAEAWIDGVKDNVTSGFKRPSPSMYAWYILTAAGCCSQQAPLSCPHTGSWFRLVPNFCGRRQSLRNFCGFGVQWLYW